MGDLVLKRKLRGVTTLAINWEGPYMVTRVGHGGAYELENMEGKKLEHLWNAEHLKKYY